MFLRNDVMVSNITKNEKNNYLILKTLYFENCVKFIYKITIHFLKLINEKIKKQKSPVFEKSGVQYLYRINYINCSHTISKYIISIISKILRSAQNILSQVKITSQ